MTKLPEEFIIFDTEYTAWEGSNERGWNGPGEYREVIQIGAVRVRGLTEIDSFLTYVKPVKNPVLSEYIINLTGISQNDVDNQGLEYSEAQSRFYAWCDNLPVGSFGSDAEVLRENSSWAGIDFPFPQSAFFVVREVFATAGVDASLYISSTIPLAFGATPPPSAHNAVNDARSILLAIQTAHNQGLI